MPDTSRNLLMTELLRFSAHGKKYAIPLHLIRSTIRMVSVTKEPGNGDTGRGTVIFHGETIPVASITDDQGRTSPVKTTDYLIITPGGDDALALRVEQIEGVIEDTGTMPPVLNGNSLSEDGRIIIDDPSTLPLSWENPQPADEETVSVLFRRAEEIASPEEPRDPGIYPGILRFSLGYEEYAVEMQYVREVILTGETTPVPGIPEFIVGISVVRGRIVSLVDLRRFFQLPEVGLTDLNRVIILSDQKMTFGLLADRILGTTDLKKEPGEAKRSTSIPEKYLVGIKGDLIVLNGKALLTDEAMLVNEQEQRADMKQDSKPEEYPPGGTPW